MNRKEFLKLTGLSAGTLVLIQCFGGCSNSGTNPPSNVDFTIDLNDVKYSALLENGGFVVVNNVLIAKTVDGSFIAVSAKCTHEGEILKYAIDKDRLVCPRHGSEFSNSGKRLSGPAQKDLIQYKVEVQGDVIRIFS